MACSVSVPRVLLDNESGPNDICICSVCIFIPSQKHNLKIALRLHPPTPLDFPETHKGCPPPGLKITETGICFLDLLNQVISQTLCVLAVSFDHTRPLLFPALAIAPELLNCRDESLWRPLHFQPPGIFRRNTLDCQIRGNGSFVKFPPIRLFVPRRIARGRGAGVSLPRSFVAALLAFPIQPGIQGRALSCFCRLKYLLARPVLKEKAGEG